MKRTKACLWALLCLLGMASVLAETAASALPLPAAYGDRGPNVRALQAELARRGYFQGETDGTYDGLTVQAVERYQKARGLPVSGLAGDETLLALLAWTALDSPSAGAGSEAPPGGEAVSGSSGIPPSSGPGDRGSHVRQLQQALADLGYLPSGGDVGVYMEATMRAVAAFQRDQGLRASGRADGDTLRVLFTKPADAAGETRMPNWYGGGSGLIPWGAVFEVKDVRTGIVFTCYRMMGTSHLDAEPLTSWDTMAIKEAYGGDWSWNRRPVLLRYQGEVYAASMNGMPHGYYSNRANAMKGHFCIHFFGSRGDTSQLIDSAHLNCAFEASFARWDDVPITGETKR